MSETMDRPVFIGGHPKSGTSLLRALLGQHPSIASGLETHWFAIDPAAGTGRHGEPLDETIDKLAAFFGFDRSELAAATRHAGDGESFLEALMQLHATRLGKPRWAEKTTENLCHVARIFARWPDARFIHIVRDPRDVYVSLRNCGKAQSPEAVARKWSTWIIDGEEAGRCAGPDRFTSVVYADVVTAPEETMRRLVAFLDEPWDPVVARFEGKRDEFDIVKRVTGHASTTLESLSRPLFNDRIGLWRREVAADELAALDAALHASGGWDVYRRVCDRHGISAARDAV